MRKKIDTVALEALWRAGFSDGRIAKRLGAAASSITDKRMMLGLPSQRNRRKQEESSQSIDIKRSTEPQQPAKRPEQASPHPFWTPDRDALLAACSGRYDDLAAISATLGRPLADVRMRWHRVTR